MIVVLGDTNIREREEMTNTITVPKITIDTGDFGSYLIVNLDTGEDILVQTDWDHPGIASSFGWVACECGLTDGTVDCEHKTASDMITDAADYLDNHLGDEIDDPGYFG